MEKIKISWLIKLLLRFWPMLAMQQLAKKLGIKKPLFDQAHKLFTQTDRIDIVPITPAQFGHRGFMIILNRKTALYFYQNSDHFIYDGFEMGEYERGEVTIFDNLKN